MGDEVQAIKAGLLEVADLVVVNKGDRPGRAADGEPAPGDARGARRRERSPAGRPAPEAAGGAAHDRVDRRGRRRSCSPRSTATARRAAARRAAARHARAEAQLEAIARGPPAATACATTGCAAQRRPRSWPRWRRHRLDPYAAADRAAGAASRRRRVRGRPMAIERVFVAGAGLMGHGIAQVLAAPARTVTPLRARPGAGRGRPRADRRQPRPRGRQGQARAGGSRTAIARPHRRRPPTSARRGRPTSSSRPCSRTSAVKRPLWARPRRARARGRDLRHEHLLDLDRPPGRRPSRRSAGARFVGMHFFSPVPVMPLVELIRGRRRPTTRPRPPSARWPRTSASRSSSRPIGPGSSSTGS